MSRVKHFASLQMHLSVCRLLRPSLPTAPATAERERRRDERANDECTAWRRRADRACPHSKGRDGISVGDSSPVAPASEAAKLSKSDQRSAPTACLYPNSSPRFFSARPYSQGLPATYRATQLLSRTTPVLALRQSASHHLASLRPLATRHGDSSSSSSVVQRSASQASHCFQPAWRVGEPPQRRRSARSRKRKRARTRRTSGRRCNGQRGRGRGND